MMMADRFPNSVSVKAVDAWIDEAKASDILQVAQRLQPTLKRNVSQWQGGCPCGAANSDGFVVSQKKQLFICRPSGKGGSLIDMVRHCLGDVSFLDAVEFIVGRPRPDGKTPPVSPNVQKRRDEARARSLAEAIRRHEVQEAADAVYRAHRQSEAIRIWALAQTIAGTLGEKYFRSRAIAVPLSEELRFLPKFEHGPSGEILPAIIARVSNVAREQIGAHLTFLTSEGLANKALGDKRKLMLGGVRGGAVFLSPAIPAAFYAVGEGIESTLSYMQLQGLGGCAALSAGGIARLVLPETARHIIIAADNDRSGVGVRHAGTARARWAAEGREVLIRRPKALGADFNDVLIEKVTES